MVEDCPTCGKEFKNMVGVKSHHAQVHDEKIGGFTHTCPTCQQSFEHKSSDATYCSQECFGKAHSEKMSGENHPLWKGGEIECECDYCGETYYEPPSKSDRPYCSSKCAGKAQMEAKDESENPFYEGGKKEKLSCEQCSKTFEVWECEANSRRFCSKACMDEWQVESGHMRGENNPVWQGGEIDYGYGWNLQKKERVRERDGRECQNCGLSEKRHIDIFGCRHTVHHIQKARSFDDPEKRNDADNLITLCKGKCHWSWESMSPLRPTE